MNATSSSTSATAAGPHQAAHDGSLATEWISNNQTTGAALVLSWPVAIQISSIVLYDRKDLLNQISGGTIYFSDKSTVSFGALNNDGSATNIPLSKTYTTTSVLVSITRVSSTTTAVGLSEIAVYGPYAYPSYFTSSSSSSVSSTESQTTSAVSTTSSVTKTSTTATSSPTSTSTAFPSAGDYALNATSSSTSVTSAGPHQAAHDGSVATEWISNNQGAGAALILSWPVAVQISQIVLYDRKDLLNQITGGTIYFSDKSTLNFGALNNDGSATNIPLGKTVTTTSVLISITSVSSTTTAVGLSEVAVYGPYPYSYYLNPPSSSSTLSSTSKPATTSSTTRLTTSSTTRSSVSLSSTTTSAAPSSTAFPATGDLALSGTSVSTSATSAGPHAAAQDGSLTTEWVSNNEKAGAGWSVSWKIPLLITSVVLYDRVDLNNQITGGTLFFSDKTTFAFGALNNDGSATTFSLGRAVNTTSVLVSITSVSSTTTAVGLTEVAIYGPYPYSHYA